MRLRDWLMMCASALCLVASSARADDSLHEIAGARRVCAAGPSEAVARAQRARGEAGIVAARVLPNPTLRVEHQQALTGATERETILGVSVPLSLGGRRGLLVDAAQARRERAVADAHATLFESALAFREAYVAAALDQAKVDVIAEQQAALDGVSATVEKLAKGGESAAYDLARQRTQARLHRRLVESAKAQAASSLALLEAWTGGAVALPPLNPDELAGGAAVRVPPPDAAGARHPRVQCLDAEARASALDARAARRRWVPEVELFVGYRTTTVASVTGHGFAASVAVPLTFFDHGQGQAAQAEAERELARTTAETLQRQHSSAQRAAAIQLALLEASKAEIEQTATDARALETKAARLYAAGEVSVTELIDVFRASEEARLGRLDLARQIAATRLLLMRSSGTLFDAGLDKECGRAAEGGR